MAHRRIHAAFSSLDARPTAAAADPSLFDPSQVNAGVTFGAETRTVLGRSSDSGVDSWDFTSGAHESIIIQGPICDRLLTESATVEIVLGCPTILI